MSTSSGRRSFGSPDSAGGWPPPRRVDARLRRHPSCSDGCAAMRATGRRSPRSPARLVDRATDAGPESSPEPRERPAWRSRWGRPALRPGCWQRVGRSGPTPPRCGAGAGDPGADEKVIQVSPARRGTQLLRRVGGGRLAHCRRRCTTRPFVPRLDAVYLPLAAYDSSDFQVCRAVGIAGASVTAPFKVRRVFERAAGRRRRAHRCGPSTRSAATGRLGRSATPTPPGLWRRSSRPRGRVARGGQPPRFSARAAPPVAARWPGRHAGDIVGAARGAGRGTRRAGGARGGVAPPRPGIGICSSTAHPGRDRATNNVSLPSGVPSTAISSYRPCCLNPPRTRPCWPTRARRAADDRRPRHARRTGAGAIRMVDRRAA